MVKFRVHGDWFDLNAVPLTFNIVADKGQILIAGEKVDRSGGPLCKLNVLKRNCLEKSVISDIFCLKANILINMIVTISFFTTN